MEALKKPQDLCEPDRRNQYFVVLDQTVPGGVRPSTAEDRYLEMEALDLPGHIPEYIASAFAVARNLWMYGWFYWPFYALAGFQAHRCIEAALRDRHERGHPTELEGTPEKSPGLERLIRAAIKDGWIRDEGFEHYRRLKKARQEQEELFRELGWLSGDLPTRSPTEYSEILARTIPYLRNQHAHGKGPLADLFGHTRLELELARDIIVQVYAPEESAPSVR
jgi:hypothetical protein